ncbi:tight junction-associated protein 1 [Octopus sinensis]|uniref:Tight junction-associated protein 1 n=1 Tax=Octopus sinensis TaxID=2607531 RepID=A0A6P7SXL8_9MOLL|nr:tight junction-associated protein 1 [Octopus sinensis]XP_036363621.1 tight junction-associated protein 1 [Octopus sinensis]
MFRQLLPPTRPHVFIPKMSGICKECGCSCNTCFNNNSLDLHQQIEELQSSLIRNNQHIHHKEEEHLLSKQASEYEVLKLKDDISRLRDRYDRLLESHKRLQKQNHNLEDKLLKVVNKFEAEKTKIQKEHAAVTSKLVNTQVTISELEEENDRYRKDCNLAVQLLQCKPSSFIAHKLNSLPPDLQERVKCHMTQEELINMEEPPMTKETKLIRIPMQTFPPTAMVYSINNSNEDQLNDKQNSNTETVPMTLIAQVLSHPEPTRKPRRTYICFQCRRNVVLIDREVQISLNKDCTISNIKVHKSK